MFIFSVHFQLLFLKFKHEESGHKNVKKVKIQNEVDDLEISSVLEKKNVRNKWKKEKLQ